jgi:hypothetical protein
MADRNPTPGDVFAAGLDAWRKALLTDHQRARGDEPVVENQARDKHEAEREQANRT